MITFWRCKHEADDSKSWVREKLKERALIPSGRDSPYFQANDKLSVEQRKIAASSQNQLDYHILSYVSYPPEP